MISDWSEAETSLRKVMLKNSKARVFMCDGSKFGKTSAFVLTELENVDYIITDGKMPEKFADFQGKIIMV